MINWRTTQQRLGVTPDGIAGRNTFAALFRVLGPNAKPEVIASLANAAVVHFPLSGAVANVPRLADFLAQTANETGGYTVFSENLNYSADALRRTWPGRFPTPESAAAVARKPELIAAKVYGDRMGNLKPEEGWTFRGRGMLQLTGRANYEAADRRLGYGLDTNPEIAAVPAMSLALALDFYTVNKVWAAIDDGDLIGARRITNMGNRYARGTPIGWDHVQAMRKKAMGILA